MLEIKTEEIYNITTSHEIIRDYIEINKIRSFERLDSLWRKENLLLRITTDDKNYVFKKINNKSGTDEIDKINKNKKEYPELYPEIYCYNENSYLMEWIDGFSFFNLEEIERVEKVALAGKILSKNYMQKIKEKKDISRTIEASFKRYREKRKKYFKHYELNLESNYFKIFSNVECIPSHNDLNAANLLYTKDNIRLIDPSEEGYVDIARDIGRYAASCFFNNYDYFGNDKEESIKIAREFILNFDESLMERTKYYIAESLLSFLNFDCVSVDKDYLKKLCIGMFESKKGIVETLEEIL